MLSALRIKLRPVHGNDKVRSPHRDHRTTLKPSPEVNNTLFMLKSTEHNFFLLINIKMLTIAGILTFMSGKNSILGLYGPKNAEFLDICILMSIKISCSAELIMKKNHGGLNMEVNHNIKTCT